MDSGISIPVLAIACFSPVALLLIHVLLCRYGLLRPAAVSPQLALVKLTLILNLPLMLGVGLIAWREGRDMAESLRMLLFAVLVFNGLAYAYFHFFNMSETARRIRMLLQIRRSEPSGLRIGDLEYEYSSKDMIEARLDRLINMRQLALETDERYVVAGRTLLWAGRIMSWWRRIALRRVVPHAQ